MHTIHDEQGPKSAMISKTHPMPYRMAPYPMKEHLAHNDDLLIAAKKD